MRGLIGYFIPHTTTRMGRDSLFDPAVILLHYVVQVLVGPYRNSASI
jgi:hypothetical protein